jgi:iron complex transport system ATP-binding protein
MIDVSGVCAGYGNDDVIHNISFKAERGESLCVLGPNGCGKSTLLRAIARILDYRGVIMLDGQDAASFSRRELAKKIAMLGQSTQVFFPYSVYETVSMGRYAWSEGFLKNLSVNDKAVIDNIIKELDILDIRDRMIDELSGGQLQRVFLAKTLAQTPEVILLDEPTNHLDLKYQVELLEFLKSYVRENNKTLIGVFHDLNLARRFGDTAIVMQDRTIAASGSIEEVMNSETLQTVYGIDIRAFMQESLGKWR